MVSSLVRFCYTSDEGQEQQQGQDEFSGEDARGLDTEGASKTGSEEKAPTEADETQLTNQQDEATNDKRKAAKQLGMPDYGSEKKIEVTAEAHYYPENCVRCDRELKPDTAKAYTAFETVDVEWADPNTPGIHLTNTKHTYYETICTCGHCTQ
ncbi:hypothetical protein [Methylobacter sp. S3L5C]|uniref:hypothetical protein n=1 Tax=Methylobacter sp. S3L5C TaxID=2839024 RepID=UPI001FAD4708|nr:hypothetical protein [Methylobacter sp. S3L5C]UOA06847.1 hypothetical protein KKZ03_10795 [Methylobacter sp. S3L5C]